jgi:excisionase family DNA binding protein
MPAMPAMPVGMSMAEYCARVGITTRTGYQWARDGKIPVRRYGKTIRVMTEALEGFKE